jgi:dTDP-glucose pyrophosphorylase/CBS domain-containing protein
MHPTMNDDRRDTSSLPLVTPDVSIHDAIAVIDRAAKGITIVVDDSQRLIGTITDGDVRRFILANGSLDAPVAALLAGRPGSTRATKAEAGTDSETLLALMRERSIRHIPLVDSEDVVHGLVVLEDLLPTDPFPLRAVVMAGGYGTRLKPLTDDMPKPMLSIGGRPLMERIIDQLRDAGIQHVNVTTHYRPDKIRDHFGDGSAFGVDLQYVNEDLPLGTAGALALVEQSESPLLVINGDILTQVNFRAMLEYHREQKADMTVAVRRYDVDVPYGVVESEAGLVQRLSEKPQLRFFVNAGIYLLEPTALRMIPSGRKFDMTDLIQLLLESERRVASFAIREYWLDIGQHADYVRAEEDSRNGTMGK